MLEEKDFHAVMKFRDYETVLAYSRRQLGKIYDLSDQAPIFQPGPHWSNLSLDKYPYRKEVFRENQPLLFHKERGYKITDDFHLNRSGDVIILKRMTNHTFSF